MPLQINLLFLRSPFNKSHKLSSSFMQFDSRSRGKFKCPFSIIYLSPVNTSYQHEAYMIGHTIPISFSSCHFYATFFFFLAASLFSFVLSVAFVTQDGHVSFVNMSTYFFKKEIIVVYQIVSCDCFHKT